MAAGQMRATDAAEATAANETAKRRTAANFISSGGARKKERRRSKGGQIVDGARDSRPRDLF